MTGCNRDRIGRERNAGEEDLHASFLKAGQHVVEIVARLADGKAAEAVVAAELDNDDRWMQSQQEGKTRGGILGCGPACALVDDFVGVAMRVEQLLQIGGIGVAGSKAQAGGDAVAIADEKRAIRCMNRLGRRNKQAPCDENHAASVHVCSVDAHSEAKVREAPNDRKIHCD